MDIEIKETKEINKEKIIELYQANKWSSAEKPDLLYKALMNSDSLITAWDGDRLVGLGNAISDGYLVVYYPHLFSIIGTAWVQVAAYLAGKPITRSNHKIQGGGYSMDLPFLERDLVSDYLSVSDNESIDAARSLAKKEGLFAGFSSGANVAAALKLLSGVEKNSSIALLINDSGLKYLSTDLYDF